MSFFLTLQTDFGFIGCSEDVLPLADFRCSGRHACEIRIPDADFDKAKPCLGDLTRYLEADYECINGKGKLHKSSKCNCAIMA